VQFCSGRIYATQQVAGCDKSHRYEFDIFRVICPASCGMNALKTLKKIVWQGFIFAKIFANLKSRRLRDEGLPYIFFYSLLFVYIRG
jgi:hypothetical protein